MIDGVTNFCAGLDISQGTEANGHGALTDWPCALKNSFHIFHLPNGLENGCPTIFLCQALFVAYGNTASIKGTTTLTTKPNPLLQK
jgi:hypothetical protein